LLDLGNGALGPLQSYLDLRELDAVLLSHLHPDHCIDMCSLYVALWYAPGGPPPDRLAVYGPVGTMDRLERAYGEHEVGSLGLVYDVRHFHDGHPVQVGPFTVTPMRVWHPVEAYGLRVEADGQTLAYSGDTDTCDNLVELARDVDLFLCEASFVEGRDAARGVHLTGLRAGQAAAQAGARRLLLTHVPPWTDPDVVLAEAESAYSGKTEVATAGLQIALG